jgi:cytoskeletal protein CcmA (bactofilin family)
MDYWAEPAMNHPIRDTTERVSLLGPKSTLSGDFATTEELVILGRFDGGRVQAPNITIGPLARVNAQIHAQRIRIEGAVIGDVYAEVAVVIHSSATVRGNIHSPEVTIQEGALVNGEVGRDAAPGAGRGAERPPTRLTSRKSAV